MQALTPADKDKVERHEFCEEMQLKVEEDGVASSHKAMDSSH
jgi:hypothetical protein